MDRYSERYCEYFPRENDPPGLQMVIQEKQEKLIKRLNVKMWMAWLKWKAMKK